MKNQVKQMNLKEISDELIKYIKEKTGYNLRYGAVTFTYHNGACVHVDSNVTRRLSVKQKAHRPEVVSMKLLRGK